MTTYHGSYSGRTSVKVLYNSVMARGDVVIANSHYTADLIKRMHAEQAGDRVQVIHRAPISPSSTGRRRSRPGRGPAPAWNVAPHERVILLAARLTAWKGQRVLIEAAARMRDQGVREFAVVLAGDAQGRTAYERELDALVAARNLGGIVRRVGHCTDMPAAFRAASVVAVPSVEPEAFGRSAVEAQALGRPWSFPIWGPSPRPSWLHRMSRPGSAPVGASRRGTPRPSRPRSPKPSPSGPVPGTPWRAGPARMSRRIFRSIAWSGIRSRSMPDCWATAVDRALSGRD